MQGNIRTSLYGLLYNCPPICLKQLVSDNGDKGYVSGNYLAKEKQVAETPNSAPAPKKSSTAKKTSNTDKSSNLNVVDKMTGLGNNQQVILVTTKGTSTQTGQFQTFEKDGNGKWNPVLQGTAYVGKKWPNCEQNPNRGSAIFLHVGNSYTLGCTVVSQNLISIMKWLDPAKNPTIIQTPEAGLSHF